MFAEGISQDPSGVDIKKIKFTNLHTATTSDMVYILIGGIPGTGEPGGLPSMGSHSVGHDWSDLAAVAAAPAELLPSRLYEREQWFLSEP